MGFLDLGKKEKDESELEETRETAQAVLDSPESTGDDVAAILEQGASAVDAEPTDLDLSQEQPQLPTPGFPVEEQKRKRGRPRKVDAQPSELELFFSKDGIGQVWVNGLNAFYKLCDAPELTPQETDMHKRVFAAWCKARMPAEASKYQPDILLAATLAMSTLPRMQPIAKTTVPLWRRLFNRLKGKRSE